MIDKQRLTSFLLSNKRIIILLLCMIVSGIVSICSGQDINWDLKNYHLYNPYAFFNGRLQYDFGPAMIQTYNNPLIDFSNYWMIMHLKPVAIGVILGCIHGINSYILYLIIENLVMGMNIAFKKWVILAACIMGFYGAANIAEIGTTFGDNVVSLFMLTGLYLLMRHLMNCCKIAEHKISLKVMLLAGLLMGFAVGMKLTAAIYPVAFVLSLVWIVKSVKEYIRISVVYITAVGISFAASIGYWMYTLWIHFGNPLFPYFNKFFKSPYSTFDNYTDTRFLPKDVFQTLFYPFYFIIKQTYTAEVMFSDAHLAVCYALLICLIAFVCYKKIFKKTPQLFSNSNYKMFLFFISFFVLSYIFWQKLFSIYRYVLLLEILSPVFVLIVLELFSANKKRFAFIFIGISIVTVCSVSRMDWGRLPWSDSYFGVEVPQVPALEGATVVMAGGEPAGYMIPFFPEKTRFLRIEGNAIRFKNNTLYQKKLLELISSSSQNYLLMHNLNKKTVIKIEKKIGLQVDSAACINFQTRLEKMCLCALIKDSSNTIAVVKKTSDQNQ